MASFSLNNDYFFLRSLNDEYIVAVGEMSQHPDGNINEEKSIIAKLHAQKNTFLNKLVIYGVVIDGSKLQQLIEEICDGNLVVNRQGLCLAYVNKKNQSIDYKAFYPLHDLFNWRKYGVNAPYPPKELWSRIGIIFPPTKESNCFHIESDWTGGADQSKEIRLNADDLFISCKDCDGEGPLTLWKVDSPSGHVKEVRFMGKIDCQRNMSRLEVNGSTLQGKDLRKLCRELMVRQVMVNDGGWCLFYTGDPLYARNRFGEGGNYYKILFRFDWEKYKVLPTSTNNSSHIWGNKYYLNEVIQPITQLVFSPHPKTTPAGLDLEKQMEVILEKEKLNKLESQLEVKKEDLSHRTKEYEELKKEVEALRAAQSKGIMGSIYREYCRDNSFVERLHQLKAISGEMHVVLAFARDYNENGTHMDGIFKVFFDKKNVTPKLIADFKLSVPSDSKVKFFLCIGNRSEDYAFRIVQKDQWIKNAIRSLTGIIEEYKFDGIDVYYSRIGAHVEMFVDAIGKVIENLMTEKTITTASLSPCHYMNSMDYKFYKELYHRNQHNFDYVVYQTQDDAHKNRLINPQELITDFKNLVSNHRYPTRKLLVGHSILPKDWDKVAYPLILAALPQLFRDDTVQGTSVWAITDDKE